MAGPERWEQHGEGGALDKQLWSVGVGCVASGQAPAATVSNCQSKQVSEIVELTLQPGRAM